MIVIAGNDGETLHLPVSARVGIGPVWRTDVEVPVSMTEVYLPFVVAR